MNTNYEQKRATSVVNRLVSLQVPGAAFLTTQLDNSVREALARKNIATVYMDHIVAPERSSNIAIDYEDGVRQAVAHLVELGHRRIGFIGGPANGTSAQIRKNTFLQCVSVGGLGYYAVDSDFTVQGGYDSCSQVLNAFDATAILAANDLMAIGALHAAYDHQILVPAKLSIVGFDDITFAQFTQPALTTVAVPRSEIGLHAFRALWSMISEGGEGGVQYEVKTRLVVRQTTALCLETLIS
jgi:DNA-binding LacI/PurR family transcriptional regulator